MFSLKSSRAAYRSERLELEEYTAAEGYTGVSWPEMGLECRLWYRSQQPRGATTSDLHSFKKLSHGGGQEPANLGGAGNMGATDDLCGGASCPRKHRTSGKICHVGHEGSRTPQMECAFWKTGKMKWTGTERYWRRRCFEILEVLTHIRAVPLSSRI